VSGLETEAGHFHEAAHVVSNTGGVGTYLDLADGTPPAAAEQVRALPLQSPGVAAYVAARGALDGPYLRFRLPGGGQLVRLWIRPALPDPAAAKEGWWPARLLSPLHHAEAERMDRAQQDAALDRLLDEPWWRAGVDEARVVARRLPADWGAEFRLHRASMNPVMTARLMRKGRLAHRSPWIRGLYLAGSSTHPGQWVSFCAVSGVLAAEQLHADLR
jgi:phytoene dehydrogenase-like protein